MTMHALRRLGAVAILVVGAIHLQRYLGAGYDAIPTIGPLFLLNAIGCGVVAVGLLAPIERALPRRRAGHLVALLAGVAVLIAVGSLIALFISETGKLFGFSEDGYTAPIMIAIVSEIASIVLLAPVAIAHLRRSEHHRHVPRSTGTLTPG